MIYIFAFFELGGGCVASMAFNASSNLIGASVRRSVLRCFSFFFDRLFTCSFSTPAGLSIMLFKQVKLAGQPTPSNALPISKPLSCGLFNSNFHPLSMGDCAIVPTERKLIGVAVQVFPANVIERTHYTALEQREETFASVHVGNRAILILAGILESGVVHKHRAA